MTGDMLTAEKLEDRINRLRAALARVAEGCMDYEILGTMQEAIDFIKAQAAEIERLTRERDEWKSACIGHGDKAAAAEAEIERLTRERDEAIALNADYEEVLADKRRLAREIDIALHGEEGAAQQASLCDLVTPARTLRERVNALEQMRPHWAKGYSNDSVAAQVTSAALARLWELLGVTSQTDAVATLIKFTEAKVAELEADKARMERAIIEMRDRDDKNGSLPPAYRAIIDATLAFDGRAADIRAALGAKP